MDYIEPGFVSHAVRMDQEAYSQALDSLVITCTDILATNNGQVLLAKRARHPQKDWWVLGGRMVTGETFAESAVRCVKSEAGLETTPERYKFLTVYNAAWKMRAHPPAEHGTQTVSILLTIGLTDDERSHIRLNDEYEDQKWLTPAEILADTDLHPAIKQSVKALQEA
jgi:ADP-ribose pyrophosphatase YjhB (NUDIX family)